MTIREYLIEKTLLLEETRLERLVEIDAPTIMITTLEDNINQLKAGSIKIRGDIYVLDRELESIESKKGRGGKTYYQINHNINFFPTARYGMYIKEV